MSKPREYWWPYAKAMIRAYPELKRAYDAQQAHSGKAETQQSMSQTKQKEYEAVTQAIKITRQMPNGEDRLAIIDMVLWKRSHTIEGASVKVHCCPASATRYHGDFIHLVGKCYGLDD